MTHNSLN